MTFKQGLAQKLHEYGLAVDAEEPRDCRLVTCPGCKKDTTEQHFEAHSRECKSFNELSAAHPRSSGPDIRVYGVPGAAGVEATLLDVTVVALNTESHRRLKPEEAFERREKLKTAKYGNMAKDRNSELVTIAVSENGTLSRQAQKFVAAVCEATGHEFHVLRKELQAIQQEAHGAALFNAECRCGLTHAQRNRPGQRPAQQTRATQILTEVAVQPDAATFGRAMPVLADNQPQARDLQARATAQTDGTGPSSLPDDAALAATAPNPEARPVFSPPRVLPANDDAFQVAGEWWPASAQTTISVYAGHSTPRRNRETVKRAHCIMRSTRPVYMHFAEAVRYIAGEPEGMLVDRRLVAQLLQFAAFTAPNVQLYVNIQAVLRAFGITEESGCLAAPHKRALPTYLAHSSRNQTRSADKLTVSQQEAGQELHED